MKIIMRSCKGSWLGKARLRGQLRFTQVISKSENEEVLDIGGYHPPAKFAQSYCRVSGMI